MKTRVLLLALLLAGLAAGCSKSEGTPPGASGPAAGSGGAAPAGGGKNQAQQNTDVEAAPPGVSTDLSGGRK